MKTFLLRRLPALLLAALLLTGSVSATLVEQTQVNLPEIDVYLYEEEVDLDGIEEKDISAALDGVPLDIVDLSLSTQPIQYCYMLDVSGSMPLEHFRAVKNAILDQWSALRPGDALALFTFGEEVQIRLSGGETKEEVEDALNNIWRGELHTSFYEAMSTLVQYLEPVEDKRCVAVVVSDGVESSQNGMTREELERTLRLGGVSVYGLCVDVEEADVEAFTEFVHLTGGELYAYSPDNAGVLLKELVSRLDDGWHLVLSAPGFSADRSTRTLTVDIAGKTSVSTQVLLDRAMADETPPEVLSVEYLPEYGQLHIVFSEAMNAPAVAEAYTLMGPKGDLVAVTDAMLTYVPPSNSVILTFSELPQQGVYTLTISGLRDASAMENPMAEHKSRVELLTGVNPEPAATPEPSPPKVAAERPLDLMPLYIAGGVIAAVLLGALALLLILYRRKRKREAPEKTEKKKTPRVKQTAKFVFVDEALREREKKNKEKRKK